MLALDRVNAHLARYRSADLSAAAVLCDEHPPEAIAFTIVEPDLTSADLTYGLLREQSSAFAGGLVRLGVKPGDRVATLMSKSADYLVALLGIWRLGAVHVPLFTAFASGAIATRLHKSCAVMVICDADQRFKLDPSDHIPADPSWKVIVAGPDAPDGVYPFAAVLDHVAPLSEPTRLGGDGALVELFTSGTTGPPKGVVVPIWALASIRTYMELGLDVRPDDVYWCGADPGWAYGLYYAVLGPMALGIRGLLVHANHSPMLTWQVLQRYGVTNLAAAPTVYRSLRTVPSPGRVVLRSASSAGEPLTPDVNDWAVDALGVAVRDHYGQTEQGMLVNNHHHGSVSRPLRAGSMGHPMPGFSVVVLEAERDVAAGPGVVGRVAIETEHSPLMWFDGYNDSVDSVAKFNKDRRWYLTGDLGSADEDGYVSFVARDDDVILMAGYRIGPFEVESALATHPAVAECAVVAAPDPVRGEVAEAYIVLRDPALASEQLATDLQAHVRAHYAAHAYPRAVHFIDSLPRTPSGKIQRFVLRDRG